MNSFNNQFATQRLREEGSVTGTGATFTPGTGEQAGPIATKKIVRKKLKPEQKDVEPKLAAGKAKIYMKDKWGWKDAPSIPNRPSKGGFIYKQLFEELSNFMKEIDPQYEPDEEDDDDDDYGSDNPDDDYGPIEESYSKFKTETKTRGKSDQFHQAVREVRKKVQEINKLFEYVSRLKSELSEGEGGLKYKVHTEKALAKIKEMVAELNQNIKKFK
jgi:hypothetical protein